MLPYYPQPVFEVGAFRIHAFALFAVAAILTARWMVLRRARRFGIGFEEIAPFYLTVICAGLAGAVAAGLLINGRGVSSLGAIVGGLIASVCYCYIRRIPPKRGAALLDIAAFAAPFAGAIGRIGCTLAHDHRGLPSETWLAFHFPEGGRYDLGFFDLLFLVTLSLALLALDRKRRSPLFFPGLTAAAYGGFRIWLQTLDVFPNFLPWAVVCAIGVVTLVSGMGRMSGGLSNLPWLSGCNTIASPPAPNASRDANVGDSTV